VAQRQRQGFLASVTPAVSYLPTGLAGCSVDSGISCDARKLAQTLRVTKKKTAIKTISTTLKTINIKA